jgi:hypothetical protein
MSNRCSKRWLSWLLRGAIVALTALAVAGHPSVAQGQPGPAGRPPTDEELAAARKLFGEALKLERKSDWKGALAKFQKVAQVKMTPQVRFHVALCHEHLGRLVEALNGFELAAHEAKNLDNKAKKVAKNAPKRAAALRKRLAYVHIVVQGTVHSSKILLDGKPISLALVDTDIPVNPGTHVVKVITGTGEVVYEQELVLEKRQNQRVELVIDDPEPPPPPPKSTATAVTPPPPAPPPPYNGSSRVPAYVVGGLGIAALGASGLFYGLRQMTIADIRDTCDADDRYCDGDMIDTAERGEIYTTLSGVMLGVGAAALATGVVLFFVLGPEDENETTQMPSSVAVVPTIGGLQLFGTF